MLPRREMRIDSGNTVMSTNPVEPSIADDAATRTKSSRRRLKLGVATLSIAAALTYGLHWYSVGRYHEKTEDAYVGGDLTVIAPKVAGHISELLVQDNQLVHAGDVLLRIDDRDFRAALAKADGTVAAQVAAVANLDAAASLQKATIASAAAEIDAASAETTRSQQDDDRYRALAARFLVSAEAAQRVEATHKIARANDARARAQLLAAQRQLDVIATQRSQATAALEEARAEREIAELNVGYTEIRAPIDGYVGNRRARVGAYATAGAQLLSLVPATGLWIDANFKEDQLARLKPGQAVEVRADILPGRTFHGHIESLAPATGAQFSILPPENATGNFTKIVQRVPVRISLDVRDSEFGALRPGLSVVAEIDTHAPVDAGFVSTAQASR
jgi:membrane fusion protein (multidrug efflux system)